MSTPDYLKLKGFETVFDTTINNELQDNIVEFIDWGLLEKGNYFNISKDQQSSRGNDYSKLKMSTNSNFPAGKAWEGFRKNWVWQSGVGFTPPPLVSSDPDYPGVTGVYVDNVFYPRDTTGDYAHNIDHFNGRVVFDNPIPTGSLVQAEFSYRYMNVVYAANVPFIRELQNRSLDQTNNSTVVLPPEMRVQLPAIAVEVIPRRTFRGYQLGGGQWIYTDVLFHCIAEDAYTRNKMVDITSMQNDKTIYMFNSNTLATQDDFPRNSFGYLNANAKRYPDLINAYGTNTMRFSKNIVQNMDVINSNFYAGTVRSTIEIIQSNI